MLRLHPDPPNQLEDLEPGQYADTYCPGSMNIYIVNTESVKLVARLRVWERRYSLLFIVVWYILKKIRHIFVWDFSLTPS